MHSIVSMMALTIALLWSSCALAVTQTRSPTNCVNATGVGIRAWTNAGNALASDNVRATVSVNDNEISNYLGCVGYGFNIPANATITGIRVNIERSSNNDATQRDFSVRLVKAGAVTGGDRATTTVYTTTDTYEAHGSATDLWGTTWTAAEINSALFGAALSARKVGTGGNFRDIYVDHIQIEVDYALPCTPPPNAPANIGLTCVCDNFGRSSLNPSTIFGADWALSHSDGIGNPGINQTTGLLRLTESTGYNAKAATVPSIFPAAGNYISVEFQHYAYNGTNPGADGIAVTLSDYSVPAVPGAFGGSLGYAQRNDTGNPPGFAGGWVGVAIDEYGNFQSPTEGRILGPGRIIQSIGVRGPGRGSNGYRWLGGTGSNPGGMPIDNFASTVPAPGHMYQVIVDARGFAGGNVNVTVNRDASTRDGTSYSTLFGPFNAYTEANFAVSQGWTSKVVPDYWKISFTGSTGGSDNIHEIGGLRICAQTVLPPTGGIASGFSAIDEGYPTAPNSSIPAYQNFQTGNIFMKLVGTPFRLWVAALTTSGISSAYAAASNRHVAVKLVDNTDGVCGTDAARTCNAGCAGKAAVEAGATQTITYTSSDPGAKLSPSFTLNSAWKNLVAVVRECTSSACTSFTTTAPACSVDSFSVRPLSVASVSTSATSATTAGTPVFKAGADKFSITATTEGVANRPSGYTGTLRIDNKTLIPLNPGGGFTDPAAGTVSPTSFSAATSGIGFSSATGSDFTYSEVGAFTLPGYSPITNATSPRGIFDGVTAEECQAMGNSVCNGLKMTTWSGIDSVSTKNDCVQHSYSNVKDATGRYGCNFGIVANTSVFGRFIPHRFLLSEGTVVNRSDIGGGAGCPAPDPNSFTYMGEQMKVGFTLTAVNASGEITKNYKGPYARLSATDWLGFNTPNTMGFWMTAVDQPVGAGTCRAIFSGTAPYTTSFQCSGVSTPASLNRAAGSRVAVLPTPAAATWSDGISPFSANVILHRADKADGPYAKVKLGIAPRDQDGVTLTALDLDADDTSGNDRAEIAQTAQRYGQMFIFNSYGSEVLDLPVKVEAQYWNGSTFVSSADDNCTPIAPANFTVGPTPTAGVATSILRSTGTLKEGAGTILLAKPAAALSKPGSAIVRSSSTSPSAGALDSYLPGVGVQTFGVYKKDGDIIYLRELHY
ncbi:MAG TPA: DUF6701 domain-containing protein [Noviherbaspirillum sp.]|uniref:DUF6701 domain-containing protein n=1 Tax=Noviherbaspirillum sp. TaxID=1926288 RepID=UPI002DDC9305|nr:DUF6701 domain-containing protein [Noviherbaspirillum sp.]HEV2610300.1 DUF6701 domain-containing protein [Noviherbaspirillum sp.]